MENHLDLFLSMAWSVVSALLILAAGWIVGNWVSNRIKSLDKLDETLGSFLGGASKYAILAIALIVVLGQFGVQTASLIAVLGAAGLAIGLALQGTLSNVAAGAMLLILRPFKIGDYVTAGSIGGTVTSIGLFGMELNTPDNVYVFAPNSAVWGSEITNYSRNVQRRQDINVGISYDDDINKAFKVIQAILKKEGRLITTEGKEPAVMVANMGDFSIDLIVRFWSKSSDFWDLKWDLTKAIKEALDKEGITIPFPTRTIEYANDDSKSAVKKAA